MKELSNFVFNERIWQIMTKFFAQYAKISVIQQKKSQVRLTEVQDYECESEMLHDQYDDRLATPAAPKLVSWVRIYVETLWVLRHVDGAECQERNALREDHRDHRRQEFATIAP